MYIVDCGLGACHRGNEVCRLMQCEFQLFRCEFISQVSVTSGEFDCQGDQGYVTQVIDG